MKLRTMTPMQLWEGYDPQTPGVELNIISVVTRGGRTETEFAFSASLDGGRTRARATAVYPTAAGPFPVVIVAGEDGFLPEDKLLASGFAVVKCDYSGERGTIYEDSVSFARAGLEGEHSTARCGADKSAVFIRAKLFRRLITAIESMPMLDSGKIAVAAWGRDANIAWQTAATDKRVKALVPMLNFGWLDVRKIDSELTDDDVIRWDIGCSIQAYAKFVECKTFIALSTNNAVYRYDKLTDTIHALNPSAEFRLFISPQTSGRLYDCSDTVIKFLRAALVSDKMLIPAPVINAEIAENKLNIGIKIDNGLSEISEVSLYYAYGNDMAPEYRSWSSRQVACDITGRGVVTVPVYDKNQNIRCFARAKYKNGVDISSEPMIISADDIKEVAAITLKKRIIYERKLGFSQFAEEALEGKFVTQTIRLEPGALDILGVATDNPILKTYRIGEIDGDGGESMLQMDICPKSASEAVIGLTTEDGIEYKAVFALEEGGGWQKLQFNPSDFKNAELYPLKQWHGVKCMTVYGADKLILNNILWV